MTSWALLNMHRSSRYFQRAWRGAKSSHLHSRCSSSQSSAHGRIERINSRLPRFLTRYTSPLLTAPLTHITSFLILHEITAIVPLFGLAAAFHWYNWLPPYISEWKWVSEGIEKFGRYFRRKGWLGDEDTAKNRWWGRGEGGMRLVIEFASAYAITKALLPARLIFSVWATPWFAKVTIIPLNSVFRRLLRRKSSRQVPPNGPIIQKAAGTGASGGGVTTEAAMKKNQ